MDRALELADLVVELDPLNYHAIAIDPFLSTLREEPRFQEFLERVKEKWEAFGS